MLSNMSSSQPKENLKAQFFFLTIKEIILSIKTAKRKTYIVATTCKSLLR